jgi:two-component system nitrogen regulation sensor histidine kinase GlnL
MRDDRLGLILDSLRVGIVAVDGAGRPEYLNAEASRILGLSENIARRGPLEHFLGGSHPAVALLSQVLSSGRALSWHGAVLPARLGGERFSVDLTASPIGAGAGIEGAVLTLTDQTLNRELEALVDQRDQSERLARLAAGIAHEVRNPLGGIRGAAELLLGKLGDPALQRYPELIRDETDRIRRLLDDLAQLTADTALDTSPLNVHRTLDALLDLHAQDEEWSGIEVVREYDPSIPEIEADPDRLSQVLLNLVRNAVQAMKGEGRLLARTRVGADYQLASREEPPLRMVNIDIQDSGPGIAAEDLPHIFTPFFTRSGSGTGLGLAIARHWTVCHGGSIVASSPAEGGTRMRVSLPVRRPA